MFLRSLKNLRRKNLAKRFTIFPENLIPKLQEGSSVTKLFEQADVINKLVVKHKKVIELPLIAIGGGGGNLLTSIVDRLKTYDCEVETAYIDIDSNDLNSKKEKLKNIFHLSDDSTLSSVQFRVASAKARKNIDALTSFLETYFNNLSFKLVHEAVFIFLGSGGTGVGVGIEVCKILKKLGKRPIPILILPRAFESSRIQFTAAAALYHFSYAPGTRSLKLVTLIIDNQLFYDENSKLPENELTDFINMAVGATLADLFVSTIIESSGYSSDLNEFLEIFRSLKGIGAILSLGNDNSSTDLDTFYANNLNKSLSLECEIYTSTRSFTFIQSRKGNVPAKSFRQLFMKFSNSDIFHKLSVTDANCVEIRGIYTGIKLPQRIEKFMKAAEIFRITLLRRELEHDSTGKVIQKIDRLNDGDEFEVHSPEEIREELKEQTIERRRGE